MLQFQMPNNENQVNLEMASFYTREYFKYDSMWTIDDIKILNINEGKEFPTAVIQASFKRKYKNYLYTIPSYVVYILTLLILRTWEIN